MGKLYFVDQTELKRILNLNVSQFEKANIFSILSRINTLYMIAKAGSGHIGSSFSSMDIFTWLHLNVLGENDTFFSSKGHDAPGLYAVMIGMGMLDFNNIHLLRRINGLPGHPDISTPFIVTNTGSLGMGISKAKGIIKANRLDNKYGRVFVVTGDGELQEGQFWESLQSAANNNCEELIVIVDYNKIQSDTWVSKVSDLGDIEQKLVAFGWHVQRCDGHDFSSLSYAISKTSEVRDMPHIIIADTIKGSGVTFMESTHLALSGNDEFYKYHSGAPSIDEYEKASNELIVKANKLMNLIGEDNIRVETVGREIKLPDSDKIQKLVPAYEKVLVNQGFTHKHLVVLDADLMIDCGLLSFRNQYPDRFIECGIAEQDMISQAGALAIKGKLPISHSFSCFMTTRANEQIFNNSTELTKCIYVGFLSGILPSGPGHSHQMVRDISILSSMPGLTLVEPSCPDEVGKVVSYAIEKNEKSTYIRMVSVPYDIPFLLPDNYELSLGKGVALTEGNDCVVFAYGPILLSEAFKAYEILKNKYKFELKVINLPWLNNVDGEWLKHVINSIPMVLTIDNHMLNGGQGELIGNTIAEQGITHLSVFKRLGLEEIPKSGQNDEVLSYHGLDCKGIIRTIIKMGNLS